MIKTVVCHCGKKWQLQRLKLGILQEESYSFHCTCGLHLADPERMAEMRVKTISATEKSKVAITFDDH
jgi:hypothetical protein